MYKNFLLVIFVLICGYFALSSSVNVKNENSYFPDSFYSEEYNRFSKKLVFSFNIMDIIHIENKLIAVGGLGVIISSKDGNNDWKETTSPTKNRLLAITKIDNNKLIAVGNGGVIISSKDGGDSWKEINSSTKKSCFSCIN